MHATVFPYAEMRTYRIEVEPTTRDVACMKVGDMLRRLHEDGWRLVATRGSHRRYKHPRKPGRVTVAGRAGDDIGGGHAQQYPQTGGSQEVIAMRYAIVIERAGAGFSAHVPDLPGCIAAGESLEAVEANIREAIGFHLDGLREDGQPLPPPSRQVDYVDIAA